MAYFPNGTSNEVYTATFCQNCKNWRHDERSDTFGCPIMDLHLMWNYDAVGKDADETKKAALEHLIPTHKTSPGECRMFLPVNPDRCVRTKDMFDG